MTKSKSIYIVYGIRGTQMATLGAFTVKKECQSFIKNLQPFTCELRVGRFRDGNTDMGWFPDWYSAEQFLGK